MPVETSENDFEYDSPFAELLDMRHGTSADGVGVVTMRIQDKHRQNVGVVQGGIIATLADYAFHRAVVSVLRPGQSAVTVELKVNYIATARDGELTATARVVSSGRRIVVCDVDVTGPDDTLIAKCLGTYLVIAPPA